jgi:hypothetical protein
MAVTLGAGKVIAAVKEQDVYFTRGNMEHERDRADSSVRTPVGGFETSQPLFRFRPVACDSVDFDSGETLLADDALLQLSFASVEPMIIFAETSELVAEPSVAYFTE